MKYREAYDKIIEAYFRDEIKPFLTDFCFCGTLANNRLTWDHSGYSVEELVQMEKALITAFPGVIYLGYQSVKAPHGFVHEYIEKFQKSDYENNLFVGMSAALDALREIHKQRGENVDEDIPAFTKRELVKVL